MSFTYDANPAGSKTDAVRFLVGDTDSTESLLSDEEINYLILQWDSRGSDYFTASMAAESIAAKFAREVSVSSDSQTLSTSELQDKYLSLAARLREQHKLLLSGANVDVGGINAGEEPDPTVAPPSFGTGMHDSVEVGHQDYGDYAGQAFRDDLLGWGY